MNFCHVHYTIIDVVEIQFLVESELQFFFLWHSLFFTRYTVLYLRHDDVIVSVLIMMEYTVLYITRTTKVVVDRQSSETRKSME